MEKQRIFNNDGEFKLVVRNGGARGSLAKFGGQRLPALGKNIKPLWAREEKQRKNIFGSTALALECGLFFFLTLQIFNTLARCYTDVRPNPANITPAPS